MKGLPARLHPSKKKKGKRKKEKSMNRDMQTCFAGSKSYESSFWIQTLVDFHKDPEREYLNVNIDHCQLGSMYFPTTNYRRTDHSRVVLFMSFSWAFHEYFRLQKRLLWVAEGGGKTVLAWRIPATFWRSVSQFLVWVSSRESYFLVNTCPKNPDLKGHLQLIFQLEQGRESWSLLLSVRVSCLSAWVQMVYPEKVDLTLREIPGWSICAPWSVCKWNNASTKPASCFLPACTWASGGIHPQ